MRDSDLPVPVPESEWTPFQRAQMRDRRISDIRLSQKYRLDDWARRQRRIREWISLSEIADWCSRVPGSLARNQELREQAWRDLARSIIAGEFIRASKSGRPRLCIAFVPPWGFSSPAPIRFRLRASYFGNGGVLAHCWVPQELAARWLLVRNLDLLPGMAARLMQEDEAEPVVSSPAEPLSLVPFDPHKARGMMIGLKHAGTPRPSREDAQTTLSGVFRDVSRDKAEAVVKIVWGEGKRGRKPSHAKTADAAKFHPGNPR